MALEGFIMTDPSHLQIAKKIKDDTWQYCEVNDNTLEGKKLLEKYEKTPIKILDDLDETFLDDPKLFFNETISFNEIDDCDIQDICCSYGLSSQELSEDEFIQLVVEGYFEEVFVIGNYSSLNPCLG